MKLSNNCTVQDEFVSCEPTGSLSPSDQSLAQIADVEHSWCLDIIPVLLGERVHTGKGKPSHLPAQLNTPAWTGRAFASEHAGNKHIVTGN